MSLENKAYTRRTLPDMAVVEKLSELPTTDVADVMGRATAMESRIRLMNGQMSHSVAGIALTIKCPAGDNLMLHAALQMAREGDFLVLSNENGNKHAMIGEIMASYLKYKSKAAGIVIDGPIRDIDGISKLGFPVYASSVCLQRPTVNGPGEINSPVCCGGIIVNPGDIILADMDGVIAIPCADGKAIYDKALQQHIDNEKKLLEAMGGAAPIPNVFQILKNNGFEIIDRICEKEQ